MVATHQLPAVALAFAVPRVGCGRVWHLCLHVYLIVTPCTHTYRYSIICMHVSNSGTIRIYLYMYITPLQTAQNHEITEASEGQPACNTRCRSWFPTCKRCPSSGAGHVLFLELLCRVAVGMGQRSKPVYFFSTGKPSAKHVISPRIRRLS